MRKDIRTKILNKLSEKQLTQKDLAGYIGASPSTVNKILGRFIENPKKETLMTMCDKLHLTYNPSFSEDELAAFNDALETKLREGKTAEEIIKAIKEL